MKQINLREYYPSYYAADTYINVPEEVFHIIVEDRRAEAALQRKKYRHRAQYSLDCSDQIEVMALAQPMNPEAILEKRQKRKELFDAVMALPDKQAKRIYARFYLGLTVKEIAELEGVHTSSVYDSIQRGLHQLKKSYGITAQLCLRPSPNLLPHPCSYKRGKYIQYSRPFITFV